MNALVRYEQARTALAECARIDEASEIRDKASALAAYDRMRTLIREARISVHHRGNVPAIVGEIVRSAASAPRIPAATRAPA